MSQAKMKTITITPDPKSFPSLEPAFVLPLTTTFTPPCYSYVRVADGPSLCGPPDMVSVWGNRGYYSPGLCPEGYSAGCSINAPGTNQWRPYPLASGETAVSCVPSGFTCITWTLGGDAFSVDDGAFTYAPAFEVRWKSSDLAIFASAASSSSSSSRHSVTTAGPAATSSGSTGTGMTTVATAATTIPLLTSLPALTGPATTMTPTSAPTPASSVQPSSGGIGVGALTGAIVGGAALVLGAFLAGFFYRRSKKTKAAAQAQNAHVESWIGSGPGGDGGPGGAPAGMDAGSGGRQQQHMRSAAEKTTSAPPPSLHGGHVEMAGCEVPALHRQSSFVPAASQQQQQHHYEVPVATQRQAGQQDPAGGQHQMPIPNSMSTSNLSIGGAGPANKMYLPYRPASFSATPGATAELPTSFIAELPADSVPGRQ